MGTLGARVTLLRTSRRLTQAQLAELAKIKQPSIAYIENGRTKSIKGKTLNGLCRALDTTPEFLLHGSDPKDHEAAMQEAELMAIWRKLTDPDRATLLRTARGLLATLLPPPFSPDRRSITPKPADAEHPGTSL